METLVELYDERPLENVLGAEMFHPLRVVYVCPDRVASDQRIQKKLRQYFSYRGQKTELIFMRAQMYDTKAMQELLQKIVSRYPDCTIDITGGTDAVLFAAGQICAQSEIPVLTYSRRNNCFYNIQYAPFTKKLPCDLKYRVEDFFMMAGGAMREGRVNNAVLPRYLDRVDDFFRIYLENRRQWPKIITYIQRVSPTGENGTFSLDVTGDYVVKGERGARISAPEETLKGLEKIGFLQDLTIIPDESISFRFQDEQIRTWLRDVGSVLELYVYKACLDSGLFEDVITSAIVDWDGDETRNAVSNEIDVMCAKGVIPIFISCKTCDAKTEALNELAILRNRFGGTMARAAIVTAERGRVPMRNRAADLNIEVIDLDDLTKGNIQKRLRDMMSKSRP